MTNYNLKFDSQPATRQRPPIHCVICCDGGTCGISSPRLGSNIQAVLVMRRSQVLKARGRYDSGTYFNSQLQRHYPKQTQNLENLISGLPIKSMPYQGLPRRTVRDIEINKNRQGSGVFTRNPSQ